MMIPACFCDTSTPKDGFCEKCGGEIPANVTTMEKEEEILASFGAVLAVAFLTIVLLVLFGYAPVSFVLGKWNGMWEKIGEPKQEGVVISNYNSKYMKTDVDCEQQAKEYFKAEEVAHLVVADINKDETYKCYGVPWKEIPLEQ